MEDSVLCHVIVFISSAFWYLVGAIAVICCASHIITRKWEAFCDCRRLRKLKGQQKQCFIAKAFSGKENRVAANSAVEAVQNASDHRADKHPVLESSDSAELRKVPSGRDNTEDNNELESSSSSCVSDGVRSRQEEVSMRRREKAVEWEEARRGLVECSLTGKC